MITFRLRLAVAASRRQEVTAVLHSLLGPIRAQQGCAATACLSDVAEGDELTFVEEWRERADLERHLRTAAFRKILAAMDLASGPPVVEIDELGSRRGFDFVEEVLGAAARTENGDAVTRDRAR